MQSRYFIRARDALPDRPAKVLVIYSPPYAEQPAECRQ